MDNNSTMKKSKTNIHPQLKANILSKLFFCWTLPMFRLGLKKELSEDDIYPIFETLEANKLVNDIEKAWVRQQKSNSRPSLWKAIWQAFKWDILISMAQYSILNFIIRTIKPLALGKLMGYYSFGETESSNNSNIIYAAVIIVATFSEVMIFNVYMMQYLQIAMKVRVACSGLIYRKTLRLGKGVLSEISVGHIVNLLSNDSQQLVNFWRCCHCLWGSPIQTIIILSLIYVISGPTALCGVGFLFLLIPTQLFMSKKAAAYRLKTAKITDERIRHMDEIITGIQVIKVYTWEQPFIKMIELIRRKEVKFLKFLNYLQTLLSSFSSFVNRTAVFLCILAYVLTGNSPNAQYVYVVFSFYSILMSAVSMGLPQAVSDILKTNISVKRIENFLYLEELKNPTTPTNKIGIRIQNATAKWSKDPNQDDTLQDINFSIFPKQTVAIVGSVGSGKSSLLQLCLGEILLVTGLVEVGGKISYANQEAWLFSGTVKQNILFGQPMERAKYEEVIKVCALEEDINQFPYGDNSIVGERGILLSGGQKARINLARALYRDADIYLLDDPLAAVDTKVGKQIFSNCINGYLKDKCTVLVTHQIQYLTLVDKIYLFADGRIIASGNYQDIQESSADFGKLLKNNETGDETGEQNYDKKVLNKSHEEQTEEKESKASGKVTRKVYATYRQAFGSFFTIIILSFLFVLTESCATGADYFITFWVNLEQKQMMPNSTFNAFETLFLTKEICIYFYSTLICILVLFVVVRSMSFVQCCMRASILLHNKMFSSIINATMGFFYTNASGRVLNRFSKDINTVDLSFPELLLDTIEITMAIVGSILAISIVNPLTFLPTLVIFLIMYFIRKVYLASSLSIKRMESTNSSPMFTHLAESTKGLTTIRASAACQILEKQFNNFQNMHTSIHYMNMSANRTFGVWLDGTCVAYLIIVTVFAITGESYGGNIGFIITRAMGLTGLFQWAIRMWGALETQMTSVERVVEYTQLLQENDNKTKIPSDLWPDSGKIEFSSVFLQYTKTNPYVLKNLNFVIKPKEKVGIVGRTGAGKSSLIPVLFRLVEFEGNVFIDNVDTKEISLSSLRSKIAIIPQDPVLFAGTVRKNLDPFDHYKDDEIWNVLEKVLLKNFVSNLPSGLTSKLSEGGSNFSVGQKQLICLARALLRKNKILILDEATANVDPQTDEVLQQTIRTNFECCTVLTIAHRLHTIMDSDRVLVMDNGVIVEFDHPSILLENKKVFYNLVMETGKSVGNNLLEIAQQNYNKKEL